MKTLLKGVYAFFMAALVLAGCQKPVEEEPVTIRLNKTLISSLPVGSTQTLTATIAPEGAKVTVVWSSEDDAVAVVNENGEVTGVAPGTTVISARAEESVATCKVTVTEVKPTAIKLSAATLKLAVEEQQVLEVVLTPSNAVADDLKWSSSDDKVAVVDQSGTVTAVAEGNATITVKCNGGNLAATCQVEVVSKEEEVKVTAIALEPASLSLEEGQKGTLNVVVTPANAVVEDLQWETSDAEVASISAGEVTAIKAGKAVITAKCNAGALSATCQITVTEKAVTPPDEDAVKSVVIFAEGDASDIQVGKTVQLTARYEPSTAKPKNVSWTVDRADFAQVDQNGLVEGIYTVKGSDKEWSKVTVTLTADGVSSSVSLRVIPPQPESIEVNLPEKGWIRVGEEWDFNPRVYPEGLGYGVTCSIMKPGNNFTADANVVSDIPGTIAAQFAVATHDNLVYSSYRKDVSLNVLPYWVASVTLPESQEVEVGGSIILSPEFTSDVEGVQPTYKDLVWSSSDEAKAVVDKNGKVTALAAGTVEITATTAGSWSVPSGEQQKSAKCTVTISEAAYAIKVGDFYFSDGTTSSTLQSGKTVIGIVISRDNATSTDKKLPAGCTHGVVLALGEGSGNWSSSYDAGRVNSWATQNGYENTTGTYYSNAHWAYVRNEYGNRLLGYNNTSALKAYIKNNGYTSGILDALEAYQIALPETASELYIPSIAEMDAVAKNLEVINAALEAAGGTKFVMDTADSQKDAYWTTSENEASSGNAATINPFTGELHGGVMKSKEKKVRFIFAF